MYELHRVTFSTLIMCNKGVCQTWITYFKSSSWVQERAFGGSSILGYCIGFWWRGGHFCICLRWKCINQNYFFLLRALLKDILCFVSICPLRDLFAFCFIWQLYYRKHFFLALTEVVVLVKLKKCKSFTPQTPKRCQLFATTPIRYFPNVGFILTIFVNPPAENSLNKNIQ